MIKRLILLRDLITYFVMLCTQFALVAISENTNQAFTHLVQFNKAKWRSTHKGVLSLHTMIGRSVHVWEGGSLQFVKSDSQN